MEVRALGAANDGQPLRFTNSPPDGGTSVPESTGAPKKESNVEPWGMSVAVVVGEGVLDGVGVAPPPESAIRMATAMPITTTAMTVMRMILPRRDPPLGMVIGLACGAAGATGATGRTAAGGLPTWIWPMSPAIVRSSDVTDGGVTTGAAGFGGIGAGRGGGAIGAGAGFGGTDTGSSLGAGGGVGFGGRMAPGGLIGVGAGRGTGIGAGTGCAAGFGAGAGCGGVTGRDTGGGGITGTGGGFIGRGGGGGVTCCGGSTGRGGVVGKFTGGTIGF